MAAFLDNCRFIPTAGGTTDWVYASAVGGCQSPAAAGAVDGRKYKFIAISSDLIQWEIAEGAYTAASGTFGRTTVLYNSSGTGAAAGQSGAGSKLSFSVPPNVAIVGVKEDLISIEEANAFTSAQQGQARSNIGAFGVVKLQKFTGSGTYTPSANLLVAIIETVGGGGGGGGATGTTGANYFGGGGGASGGYSRKYVNAATIGASQTVTVGAGGSGGSGAANGAAGGDTSVGSLCSAKGGSGGQYSAYNVQLGMGGAGVIGGIGDVIAFGSPGGPGIYSGASVNVQLGSGVGGSSVFGGGAVSVYAGTTINGVAASNYGAGGSGAYVGAAAGSAIGGAGSPGVVVITEFCAA